ncbi:DEAD/DEAH box helicase [Paraburkholderia sp.]|uniref:DEAD/DEAH box helicase n=1 Tax=Paraburkholderia sp. TaxID=1926495 RepID=UPI0039E36B60
MSRVSIAFNATVAKLMTDDRTVKLEVQRLVSYKVAGAEMTDAFKCGPWDGRSSFFDFRRSTFPAGFVHLVTAGLRRKGYEVDHVAKAAPEPLGPANPKIDSFPDDPRYDYQPDVVGRLVKHRQIIAQVATGGGKSRIARLAFARIRRPTLFLTTRSILMYQMKDAFEEMGITCSVLGDGQFGTVTVDADGNERHSVKMMSVGMVQTLVARLQEPCPDDDVEKQNEQIRIRNKTIALLEKFEFVIGEEAHEAGGNSYYEILRHCKNAHYRLALTATPFMKDDEESNMRLMAAFGPIGIRISEQMLIERGILARPVFKYVQLKNKPVKLFRGTTWQAAYRIGIVDNIERNAQIVYEARRGALLKLPVMILVQQTRHGELLRDMLNEKGCTATFIQGESKTKERKKALEALRDGETKVLIGTTILDVGVDVPAVGLVILAGGGKAEVALRQRIGRGARAKKKGPNVFLVVDFDDPFNSHTKEHAKQRRSIVDSTPGFAENVLPDGVDFDFVKLGLATRKAA